MKDTSKDLKLQKKDNPAESGKKAIEAGKKSMGENASDPAVKRKEQEDAKKWRNEG